MENKVLTRSVNSMQILMNWEFFCHRTNLARKMYLKIHTCVLNLSIVGTTKIYLYNNRIFSDSAFPTESFGTRKLKI